MITHNHHTSHLVQVVSHVVQVASMINFNILSSSSKPSYAYYDGEMTKMRLSIFIRCTIVFAVVFALVNLWTLWTPLNNAAIELEKLNYGDAPWFPVLQNESSPDQEPTEENDGGSPSNSTRQQIQKNIDEADYDITSKVGLETSNGSVSTGWSNKSISKHLASPPTTSSKTKFGLKRYTKKELDVMIESLSTTKSIWSRSKLHSWCHANNAMNEGLLYVKLPKCASSTASGVSMRVADKLGRRILGQNCVGRYLHSPASYKLRQYGARNETTSLLWSMLREPNQRLLSHYFFEQVSRQEIEPTETGILSFIKQHVDMKKTFMLRYLKLQPLGGKEPAWIREMMRKYDFIGVSDRMDESLVVLALIMQVPVADMVMLSSKVAGGYDAGRGGQGCVKLVPKQSFAAVDNYLQTEDWKKNNWDQILFQVVNRTLDKTIDHLGRENVARKVESLRLLTKRVHDKCLSEAVFPCPATLPNHTAVSEKSCYFADSGCGYRCIDEVLRETSDLQWRHIQRQLGQNSSTSSSKDNRTVQTAAKGVSRHDIKKMSDRSAATPTRASGQDTTTTTSIPDWMQRYIQFHRDSIEGGKIKDGVPFLVYQCYGGCAGLGGRIKAMIKSFYTAVCSNRVFLIDSPFPFPLQDYLAPNMIQWNATFPSGTAELDIYIREGTAKNNIVIPEDEMGVRIAKAHGKKILDLAQIWLTPICRAYAEENNKLSVKNIDEQVQYHWGSQVMFEFTNQVASRANELRKQASLVSSAPYVGIHLRTGSGSTWNERSRRLIKQKLVSHFPFVSCFRLFQDAHGFTQAYLAADNDDPKLALHKQESLLKIATVQGFHIDKSLSMNTTEGIAAFQDKEGNNGSGKASIETAKLGTLDLFAEFKVLVDAECIIMSRSSLSYAAHFTALQPHCGLLVDDCSSVTVEQRNLNYDMTVSTWKRSN